MQGFLVSSHSMPVWVQLFMAICTHWHMEDHVPVDHVLQHSSASLIPSNCKS